MDISDNIFYKVLNLLVYYYYHLGTYEILKVCNTHLKKCNTDHKFKQTIIMKEKFFN